MQGLINNMRNILRDPSLPSRGLASGTAKKASSKRHILGDLLPGNGRMRSGHQSPAGSLTSLYRHPTPTILVFLAVLALGLLFLLPGGLLHAQDADGPIMYAENDTGAVATFTAVDPEGESIVWSLASGNDMEDFSIENGVLRFNSAPDFEAPADADTNNTYVVTVEASDGGDDTTASEAVTIEVTNVEEPGTVTLSTLQPQVDVAITVTLTDPDTIEGDDLTTVSWQWYRGNSEIVGATDGPGTIMSSYTPTTGDVGSVLRATAMYDDGEDEDKTAQGDSAHAVRQAPESNIPPTFPDQNLATGKCSDRADQRSGGEHACGHEYWRSRCSQ